MVKEFDPSLLKEIQFELTSKCTAACPQCTRNINGGPVNPHIEPKELSFADIQKGIDPELISQLQQVFFCGGYGEPILHSQFLDLCSWFRQLNPKIYLLIHTNASAHSKDWWKSLAKLLPVGLGRVNFGIDGLEDTHQLHRRNTSWRKIIENAQSFIEAGGEAQWSFLVFKHNEHQVEDARKLSHQLGFKRFLLRRSGRFFDQRNFSRMEKWRVLNKDLSLAYQIELPSVPSYRNPSLDKVEALIEKYGSFESYLNQTPVQCDALLGRKMIITVDGLLLPCGFLNENLFDARFFDPNVDPGAPSFDGGALPDRTFANLFSKYGYERLSIRYRSIPDILKEPFFREIQESWGKPSVREGKLFECALTCGKEFRKCWDQGA